MAFGLILSFICCCLMMSGEIVAATKISGITVDLIHSDSPLSPFYDPSQSRFDRLRKSFLYSRGRLRYSNTKKSKSSEPAEPEAPLTPIPFYYIMKVLVGTPPVEVYATVDTGSDLSWTQCAPCLDCYKQKYPLFDRTKSKTYANVPCKSQECLGLRFEHPSCANTTTSNDCIYQITYASGSSSAGDLATETFVFGQNSTFPKVVFGCGRNNGGVFGFDELTSGIIGLGGGPVSIIRQFERKYSIAPRFSYCLPNPDSNVTSKISFGSNAIVTGPNVMSTPLVKKEVDTFYYVTLEGFSVGNKKLEFEQPTAVGEGNIFIDSGSPYTYLPGPIFYEFVNELNKALNGSQAPVPGSPFTVCYYGLPNNGGKIKSPPITAHFRGGADLVLPQEGVFVEADKGVFCLTMFDSYEPYVFGNYLQINHLIGFDLENHKVDFLPTHDCGNPN